MYRARMLWAWLAAVGLLVPGCASRDDYTGRGSARQWVNASPNVDLPADAPAAHALPAKPVLEDYLAHAALSNPQMEAAFHRWRAAALQAPQTRSLPNPSLTYRYYIEQVETRVGPQRQAVQISQMFPWFGKLRLAGEAADQAAEASRQRYEAVKLKLFYQVADAYCEYYYLKRAIDITGQNIELLKSIEIVASARYRVAAAAASDVVRAQVELGKLDDRLRTLQELRAPILAELNAALNRSPDAPLPWPTTLAAPAVDVEPGQWSMWMRENNPDLKAIDSEIARLRLGVDLAGKNYYPNLGLGVQWIDTASAAGAMQPSDSGQDAVIATLTIDLPIWREKLDAGRRQARRRLAAGRADKVQTTNALEAKLKMALYKFNDAERKMALYRATLTPKAKQSLNMIESTYRAGEAGFIDLLDAVRVLLEFDLAYERALASRAQRLAELEMLIGRSIPTTNDTTAGAATNDGADRR